jgi:hypothetical protein
METKLYTVTLTDLGTYQLTVAADSVTEAQNIAKRVLCEEAQQPTAGLSIVKREVAATAELDEEATANAKPYRAEATYSVDFEMVVPATNRDEAKCHARRLYAENCGPFEFNITDEHIGTFSAWEVPS